MSNPIHNEDYDAGATSVSGVDLTAVTTTQYTSDVLNLGRSIAVNLSITAATATAGTCEIRGIPCDGAGNAIGAIQDICTAIDTTASLEVCVSFGPGMTSAATSGTVSDQISSLLGAPKIKYVVEVGTAGNGTQTADLRVLQMAIY